MEDLSKEAHLHMLADTAKIRPGRSVESAVIAQVQGDTANLQGAHLAPKEPGFLKQLWEMVPRIGDGHFSGMLRLGGHELTQSLAAFPDSNIRPMDEPGVFGNATPQIITDQMGYDPSGELMAYEAALAMSARRSDDRDERSMTR